MVQKPLLVSYDKTKSTLDCRYANVERFRYDS